MVNSVRLILFVVRLWFVVCEDSPTNNAAISEDTYKMDVVREMMLHAWSNYRKFAWGRAYLSVTATSGENTVYGCKTQHSLYAALDTLLITGLYCEYKETLHRIIDDIKVEPATCSYYPDLSSVDMGVLLSTYALTCDPELLDLAITVADRITPVFENHDLVPYNYHSNYAQTVVGGYLMEFSYLASVANQSAHRYNKPVDHTLRFLKSATRYEYIASEWIWRSSSTFTTLYFYDEQDYRVLDDLLNAWRLSNNIQMLDMFDSYLAQTIDSVKQYGNLWFTTRENHEMVQSACSLGGMFALLSKYHKGNTARDYLAIGRGITDICHEASAMHSFQEPTSFTVSECGKVTPISSQHYQSGMTAKSYFILYRVTQDPKYREWGWEMVKGLQGNRTANGFPSSNGIQSFELLSNTLKYLYLLFSDGCELSLDEWVFNRNGHPFPLHKKCNI